MAEYSVILAVITPAIVLLLALFSDTLAAKLSQVADLL
jgi:Flp pilus assembly pilin Flp